ncbi:hypothetical protein AAVH_28161 [Aphelenchoides avenae]|nr:hypothetical protein AAVH_28161 [Aphelenchus avenae]
MMRQFLKAEQSDRTNSLYDAPISIRITTIKNDDSKCLFYAVEASRIYQTLDKDGGMKASTFSDMIKNLPADIQRRKRPAVVKKGQGRPRLGDLTKYVADLLHGARIDPDLNAYSMEEHLTMVQEYYNQRWPGMYRVVAFSEWGRYRPAFIGDAEGARYDVGVYHSEDHFDGVRSLGRIFDRSHYCVDCKSAFNNRAEHNARCVRKCSGCSRMGADYPCQPDATGYRVRCCACNKTFRNEDCYNSHKGRMCA